MSGISEYEIGIAGVTNNIVIGRTRPIVVDGQEDADIREWVEMSDDKTKEAILAVIRHMAVRLRDRKKEISYEIPGRLKLTLEDISEKE